MSEDLQYALKSDVRIVDHEGHELRTGLWLPAEKSQLLRSFSSVCEMSREEVVRKLRSRRRIPAEKRFPAEQFIKNQGRRGSCNGYAVAAASRRARKQRGLVDIALSGESMYAQINGGRDQGSGLDKGMAALEKTGIAPESMVKHETYLWRDISPEARAAMSRFRGFECYGVDNELELAAALAADFFCVVAMHFSAGSSQVDSEGYVQAGNGPGNHAIASDDCIVDSRGNFVFEVINSHGLRSWKNGRGRMTWERHFRQCAKNHRFYAIKSTVDDPESENPFLA